MNKITENIELVNLVVSVNSALAKVPKSLIILTKIIF